jgi:RimJ/RimL family protein N-acetyltransferase
MAAQGPTSYLDFTLDLATLADGAAITSAVQDPRIYRMVGRIAAKQSLTATESWLSAVAAGHLANTDHVFCIRSARGASSTGKADTPPASLQSPKPPPEDTLLGMVGAHRAEIGAPFDIGYWVAPEFWGSGLATRAARACMQWLELRGYQGDFVAGHFVDNPASGRVLTKLGFVGFPNEPYFCLGRQEWVDHRPMRWYRETPLGVERSTLS